MPYCDLLMNYLLQELSWTKCQDPNYGYDKPYRSEWEYYFSTPLAHQNFLLTTVGLAQVVDYR